MKKQKQEVRNITDDFIRKLPPLPQGKDDPKFKTIWDKKSSFKLLQYKSGGIVFWSYHWFDNKTIFYNQGKWNENTNKVSDVRLKARNTQSKYVDKGLDPRLEKKRLKLEAYREQILQSQKQLFKQVIEKYIEADMPRVAGTGTMTHDSAQDLCYILIGKKRTSKLKFYDDEKSNGHILRRDNNLRSWNDFWTNNKSEKSDCVYDSVLGHVYVEDVKKTKVKRYLNKFATIEMRRHNKNAISTVVTWAIDNEFFGDDPPTNPCFGISLKRKGDKEKTQKKIKVYSTEELQRIWVACDQLINKFPFQTTVIKLLSVTSLRKKEALKLRRDYIKENDSIIELPYEVTKIRINQDIDINSSIQTVLNELKMLRKKYPWSVFLPWVFPSFRVKNKNTRPRYSKAFPHKSHLQDIKNCWREVKLLAKVDGDTGRFKKTHHNLVKDLVPDPYEMIGLTRHTNTAILEGKYLTQDLNKRKAHSQKLGNVYSNIFGKKGGVG